jgi:hypothetical protein
MIGPGTNAMARMKSPFRCALVTVTLLGTCIAAHHPSVDWGDCQDELDQAKQTAADASDAAEEVHSKLEDVDDCRENPDVYDLMRDGCRSQQSDYDSAIDDFRDKMDEFDTHIHSIQSSCAYEFTVNRISSTEAAQQRLCSSYRKLIVLGIAPNDIRQQCKQHMDEQWCENCLRTK